jgi:cell division protein FtsI/penicillin-binding protein 2
VLERESKRDYPHHRLACHIIGFTKPYGGGDNIGQAGLESVYDSYLSGSWRKLNVPTWSWGKHIAPLDPEAIKATSGNTLVLTLNSEIQMFAEDELRKQVNRMGARGGTVIVMDVPTGGILALANCPDFDLGDFARFAKEAPETLRNRALTDPYEIGSVMKIFTASILVGTSRARAPSSVPRTPRRGRGR